MKYVLDVLIKLAIAVILWGFIGLTGLTLMVFWYLVEELAT